MLVATNAPGHPGSEIEEDSPSRSGRPQGRPPRRVRRAFRELTAEEFQERRTKRRCWTLQSRVERMGRIGGIFSATIFLDATSRCWIGTMGVPTGQQIPNLNRIVGIVRQVARRHAYLTIHRWMTISTGFVHQSLRLNCCTAEIGGPKQSSANVCGQSQSSLRD
jgi:hypothetical protein